MMTDTQPPRPEPRWLSYLPRLNSRWWTGLLALSLMANLLVGGLALGHRFGGGRGDARMPRDQAMQIVPRKFFADLPAERRRELLRVVRSKMRALRNDQQPDREAALKLADVLGAENMNKSDVQAAIAAFNQGPQSLPARTGKISEELIDLLTPEERKALSAAIKERALQMKSK
jgi:Spy/CpxP family protein refolding chaperone